jgi:chemotaxis protein methyltransferase WspC
MSRAGRTAAAEDGGVAAVEAVLRECIGLDATTIGTAAIERAIRTRLASAGVVDVASYAARIRDDRAECDRLVEEVVVGESWFFRDRQVFEFVTDFAVTRAGLPGRGPVRILCAPCAGGEEPYSVAMALLDAGLRPGQFTIDAVDVSRVALARAARGRYSANAFRNADCSFRDRWFTAEGAGSVIIAAVQDCVAFAHANLLDESFVAGRTAYDIVFCRNLLIYLTTAARARVEATLDRLLAHDGVLVLGAAEPPILKGDWLPAGAASVFAMRRGVRAPVAPPARAVPPVAPRPAGRSPQPAAPAIAPAAAVAVAPVAPPAESAGPALADVLAEAGALANQRRHAEALEVCERARQRLPPAPALFFLMGMLHQAAGDLDRAEGCLHKTLYLDAAHDEALLALALLATRRGDTRMADAYRQSAARVLARKESP